MQLKAVAFPDPSHAWVAGDSWQRASTGTVYTATNRGEWTLQKSEANCSDLLAAAFSNARCGWVVGWAQMDINGRPEGGDVNVILATTDGGATWHKQPSGTDYELFGIACASTTKAWAVGGFGLDKGIITASTDGGDRWKTQYLTKNGSLQAVAFADVRHGWAVGSPVGGDWQPSIIVATTNGGAIWKQQVSVADYHLDSVACPSARDAWAAGGNGSGRRVILATTDGGASWKVQYAGGGADFSGIAFADATHGWAVGGDTILATTDGGRSWKPQHSGTTMGLCGVAFADVSHGLAVGNSFDANPDPMDANLTGSTILTTSDGGATWEHK